MENAKITSPYCARDKRNSRISCGASAASTCRSRKFNAEESAMTAMAAQRAETEKRIQPHSAGVRSRGRGGFTAAFR